MASLGKDIGSETIVRGDLSVAGAGATTSVGRGANIAALSARPQSVRAHIFVRANLDSADTYIADNIKVESAPAANFAGAVSRGTAADITLTGAAADTDYFGEADIDIDLTQLPETHTWIRVSVRHTLSDVANTTGVVNGTLVFGGLSIV